MRKKNSGGASGWDQPLLACGLIVLVALVVYANSLLNPFFYDDEESISLNPSVQHLWPIWAPFSPPDGSNLAGRPLLNFIFALDYAIGGEEVWIYHATNLLIHLLAALTLFGLVRRTLQLPVVQGRYARDSLLLASAVALLWLVHPLQTESVSYISQRSESTMGLFYLLTLYCFIRSTSAEAKGRVWLSLSVGVCLLGMAVKEVMMTAPVMVLVYDRTFVAGTFREAWRQRWRYYAGLMATWLLLGYLLLDIGRRAVGVGFGATPWDYALTQCRAIVHYLVLTAWPHPLVIDYGMTLVADPWQVLPQALILAGLFVATAVAFLRKPVAGFLGVWFFLILAPTSSVIPIMLEPIAEHRFYLPLATVILLLVLGLYTVMGRKSRWPILFLIAAWSVVTFFRNEDYGSGITLWQQSVAENPENPRAHHNEGLLLLREGRLTEAIEQFEDAVRIFPQYVDAQLNWGFALAREGEYPEAIGHYQEALRINPNYFQAQNNWGAALAQSGKVSDAVSHFREAIRLNPGYADAHRNLGLSLLYLGHQDEAREQFVETLEIDPGSAIARECLEKIDAQRASQAGK